MKYNPNRTIFRIDYQPKLSFYEKLYKDLKLTEFFPHWHTDRLKIVLKDYDFAHSLTIAHNYTVFVSDKYNQKKEEAIFGLIRNEILNYVSDQTFTRFGLRRFFIFKQDMNFDELVEILNLKCFSDSFLKYFNDKITDSTITIDTFLKDYKVKIIMGPTRKSEIPQLIQYYNENHINPDPIKRVENLNNIFASLPEVAFYLDVDFLLSAEKLKIEQTEPFLIAYKQELIPLIDKILSDLFQDKIKC